MIRVLNPLDLCTGSSLSNPSHSALTCFYLQEGTFPSLVDILPFAIEYLRIERLRSLLRNQLQGLYMAIIAFQEKANADLYHHTLGLDKCTVQIGPHTVSVKPIRTIEIKSFGQFDFAMLGIELAEKGSDWKVGSGSRSNEQ